ncbi:MAG TPA: TRAP transporter substrate-binding protein [Dehalococcoidales bacterium]|nr:TRAP transporter substrate-binding protein [Dehalococcoidales bacterium]
MKKMVLIVMTLALISSLVIGCAQATPTPTPTTPTAPVAQPTPTTPASPTTPAVPAKTWNLRFSFEQAPTAPYSVWGHAPWAASIEAATKGRVKVTLYDSSSLSTSREIWNSVQTGVADLGWLFTGLFPGQFSIAEVSCLPFLFPNAEVGSRTTWALLQEFPEIRKAFDGVVMLTAWTTDPYFMISRSKHYTTVADWKGQNVRAPGGPPTDFVRAMGANPMSVPMPDCYLSLQRGVFDAMLAPAEAYVGWKLHEVAPYVTYFGSVQMYHAVIMNQKVWNEMPKEIQDQIMSVSGEVGAVLYGGGVFDRAYQEVNTLVAASGGRIREVRLPDAELQRWIEIAGKPVWDGWVTAREAAGFTNARAILERAKALSAKFAAQPSMVKK